MYKGVEAILPVTLDPVDKNDNDRPLSAPKRNDEPLESSKRKPTIEKVFEKKYMTIYPEIYSVDSSA